ncbi:MAG TPA: HAD family phosphatase [Dongiaceae bacterium]|nr:HAD family phosphatase [Dongiaceae bacterium]
MPAPIPVFDVGNVLIRWDPRNLYRKLIADEAEREDFLARICSPEWNLEMDRGRPFAEGVAERVALFPQHEALIRAFDERWLETLDGAVEESVAILEELRAAGVKTYAITNFSGEKFALTRNRYPFLGGFEGIIVSAHEQLLKPDLRIYALLCERHGLAPADCVFIDDNLANVEGARAFGMQGHHFKTAAELRADLRQQGLPLR